MKAHPTLVSLCGIADDATEADLSGLGMDANDAVILADELPAKGALEKLLMSDNKMATKEAGKALAEALAANSVLKELDVSSNAPGGWGLNGPGFAQELAVGLKNNGALVKFDISNSNVCAAGGKALAAALNGNQVMTELNLAGNRIGLVQQYGKADMSGVMDIAYTIPTMGALTFLNLAGNYLFAEGAKHIAEVIKGHVSVLRLD